MNVVVFSSIENKDNPTFNKTAIKESKKSNTTNLLSQAFKALKKHEELKR